MPSRTVKPPSVVQKEERMQHAKADIIDGAVKVLSAVFLVSEDELKPFMGARYSDQARIWFSNGRVFEITPCAKGSKSNAEHFSVRFRPDAFIDTATEGTAKIVVAIDALREVVRLTGISFTFTDY